MLNFLFLFQNGLYLNKYSEYYYLKHTVSAVVLQGTKNITVLFLIVVLEGTKGLPVTLWGKYQNSFCIYFQFYVRKVEDICNLFLFIYLIN